MPVVLLSDAYSGRVASNTGSRICTQSSNTPWKDKRGTQPRYDDGLSLEPKRLRKMMMIFFDGKRNRGRDKRGRETPNTCVLAQTTLKITLGCLCRGPSRRFQGACRFQHTQKNLLNGETLWSVFPDGSNETRKKTRACELVHHKRCSKWPPLGAHARQASVNEPCGARFSAASGSRSDNVRTIMARSSNWDVN